MPYYDVANLVTVTKTNLIHEMPCSYGTLRSTPVKYGNKSPADLRWGLSCSKIWLSYKSNLVASWMPLHDCRCFHEHLRMLWQSLREHYLVQGGPGSIGNYLGATVRATRVSRWFACGFWTDLHFDDVTHVFTRRLQKCEWHFYPPRGPTWWVWV